MHRSFVLLAVVLLLLVGCAGPKPTRVAVPPALPPIDETKALVVFMFPPCARYSGPAVTPEERMLCRDRRSNRIRVVDRDARLVTDIGFDQYGASYEEPGRHLYAALHHGDHCTWDRTDCVAALKANLEPGKIYFVTFRWDFITRGRMLIYGRLEITPVRPERVDIFRTRLADLKRVEPVPGHRELGLIGELRSADISSRVQARLAQDRQDGVGTPFLGGRVTAEEIE